MLMISSATSRRMSSSSARAISMRWSCPPLSWCGYLSSTSPGLRLTASSDPPSFACHSEAVEPGEVRAAEHREDAVGLEDRVVGAERVLEDALDVGVVLLQLPALQGRDVDAVEADRAARDRRRRRIIFPIVDFPLPLSPISDTTSPGCDGEADVTDREQLAPAEGADAVGLAAGVEPRASGGRLPARGRVARARAERRAAPPRTSRTRAGSGPGTGSRPGDRAATEGAPGCPSAAARRTAPRPPAATRGAVACTDALGESMIVAGGRLLGELAGVHDEDRVGDLVEHREVVRDHDDALDEAAVAELDEQLG